MTGLEGTPEEAGHAGLSTAAARDVAKVVDRLSRDVGKRAAVAWTHTGALLAWSAGHDLIDAPAESVTGWRDGVKRLADVHPALTGFTDPDQAGIWDAAIADADVAVIAAQWGKHPVTDPPYRPHGYMLGNAYQAVNEEARKGRALCQTPRFVTDLLLELGLDPALEEHGAAVRMIDPACGTGHILVETLIHTAAWNGNVRGAMRRGGPQRVREALETLHGVDVDPWAVLIARLRLVVLAAGMYRGWRGEDPLPVDWPINVATADALLDETEPLLQRGQYHAVIMNPPYVTCKDDATSTAIRRRYPRVCHGKYSLALPFHALAHELVTPGGWTAQLTANSFMKREFGAKYIKDYLASIDLQWLIDSSGAYIPGHGTPTVIIADRYRAPVGDQIPTVLGIRGEPRAPADPSKGLVWSAIADGVRDKLALQELAAGIQTVSGTEPEPEAAAEPARQETVLELLSPPTAEAPSPSRPRPRKARRAPAQAVPGPSLFDEEAS